MAKSRTKLDHHGLKDRERLVLKTRIRDDPLREALLYLEAEGHKTSRSTYYEIVAELEERSGERLSNFAEKDLVKKQMARLDEYREIKNEQWARYRTAVQKDLQAVASQILERIAGLNTYIAAAESDTVLVIEKQMELSIQLSIKIKAEKEAKPRGKNHR